MILRRFPRLSETFILNEIRGLERLGLELRIVSLLPPEECFVHAALAEVKAPVVYFPTKFLRRIATILRAHVEVFRASPRRYREAVITTLAWTFRSRAPLAAGKEFWRAGFVAAFTSASIRASRSWAIKARRCTFAR
jgi:hypothetical protein